MYAGMARRLWFGVLGVVLLVGAWPVADAAVADPVGSWVGGLDVGPTWAFFQVELAISRDGISGTGRVRPWEREMRPVDSASFDGDTVAFHLGDPGWAFRGRLVGDTLTGQLTGLGHDGTVTFRRVLPLSDVAYHELVGPYVALPGNEPLFVGMDGLRDARYYAQGARQIGLFPVGGDEFLSATGERVEVVRDDNGSIVSLAFTTRQGDATSAIPTTLYREEAVQFTNGDVSLAGSLLLPTSSGPYPAVVLTQGSGPETRERRRNIADAFARNGIAALIYDKRGTGNSTGDWYTAGFLELTHDALAGVALLTSRSDIVPDQVGLWGLSQGGWIVPIGAVISRDVAFAITVSAAGMSPAAQELFRWHNALTALGYSEPVLDAGLKGVRLMHDLYRLNLPFTGGLFPGIEFDYDPLPVLARVKQPLLGIWGQQDTVVPSLASEVAFAGALSANSDVALWVLDGAGHSMALDKTLGSWEAYPDGYLSGMVDWVTAHTQRAAPRWAPETVSVAPSPAPQVATQALPVVRPPWFGQAAVQLALMSALLLVFGSAVVVWPAGALARARRRRRAMALVAGDEAGIGEMGEAGSDTTRDAGRPWTGWIWAFAGVGSLANAALVASFPVMLVRFLIVDDGALAGYYSLTLVRAGAALAAILAFALPAAAALALPRAQLRVGARVHIVLVALAAIAMVSWLLYWRLLGL